MPKLKAKKPTRPAPRSHTPVTLAGLHADPQNRRLHPDRNIALIAASLREVGSARSIVIDETNAVLAGNGVLEAAPQVGISKLQIVDVEGDTILAVRRRGLTKDQKRALALYDNRTGELSEWNAEQLRADAAGGLDLTAFFSELAGFRTLLANDVDAHACRMYAKNLHSPIDSRDIRTLTTDMLLARIGLRSGALDVFEGSPPCTAFSTAGHRANGWGQFTNHAGTVQANVEDLFFDWLRLLEGLRPRAFVAENVTGLVKGVAKGYFKMILRQMKQSGYRTEARILDAQWLGVPQCRGRVIFIGIREDLNAAPRFPTPLPYHYSVRDALPWLTSVRCTAFNRAAVELVDARPTAITRIDGASYFVQDGAYPSKWSSASLPSPAIMAGRVTNVRHDPDRRKFTIDELKRLCSFPIDYDLTGAYSKQWARLGNSVPPLMAAAIGAAVRDVLLEVDARARP